MHTVRDDHRNPSLSLGKRVELLLDQMTIPEKCWQLTAVPPWFLSNGDGSEPEGIDARLRSAPGHVSGLTADDPRTLADIVQRLQRLSVTRTRLGIPLLIHAEASNGLVQGGHMVFPTPIGLAATWSPDLIQEMADLIGRQMRRLGLGQALAPVMDVALDPRWGRVHETYGEDPYLCAAFSVAYTLGLQGADLTRGAVATSKHFLGYGAPSGGINLSAYEGGERRTRDLFAYPFEAAIQLAGLRSVMNSYSDVNGVPAGISREVLTDLLRGTLGFDGFVSADYMTLDNLVHRQRVAADAAEAGRLGIAAGLDVEFPSPFGYGDVLANEVQRGAVDLADLDRSVGRVLRAKFELGLFENPYPREQIDVAAIAAEGTALSLETARRSVVLAKNDGILPLTTSTKVAVIGPHADAVELQFPTYTYPAFREMTLIVSSGGMANMVGIDPGMALWNDALLDPIDTATLVRARHDATSLADEVRVFSPDASTAAGSGLTRSLDADAMADAVDAASAADVVVLALGGASLWFNGERTEGEASDSADISLPTAQQELVAAIARTGKPLVVVLFQGRAYALPEVVQSASAIVVAPYGGPYGPRAVAEVLFGAIEPSGRLPYSIPRHSGQIPVYHHQKAGTGYRNPVPQAVENHYLDMAATPLFPFGHGLGYTAFALSEVEADNEIDTSSTARISARLTNTGMQAGTTVVQLYLRLNSSAVTRPAQQLAGFLRVALDPGQSRRVSFSVDAAQLGYTNLAHDMAVEPGKVEFYLGFAADDRQVEGTFHVVGKPRILASAERSFLSTSTIV